MDPSLKQPNFFIVGAPKCGTTALYTYLSEHPNIFMSPQKEPHFFSDDIRMAYYVHDREHYLSLFAAALPHHQIIGEGSVHYLYSKVALEKIKAFNPQARLLVMLRNPVDMVYAYYFTRLRSFREDVADFETAWRLQALRQQGKHIPPNVEVPALLQYGEIGKLGQQMERLYRLFNRDQVKFVFFDDFIQDTAAVYRSVLAFLDVANDGRREFERINAPTRYHLGGLARWLLRPPAYVVKIKQVLGIYGPGRGTGLATKGANLLKHPTMRPPLSPRFRQELIDYFQNDIHMLQDITHRDLSAWLTVPDDG